MKITIEHDDSYSDKFWLIETFMRNHTHLVFTIDGLYKALESLHEYYDDDLRVSCYMDSKLQEFWISRKVTYAK